jgi:hypothetical protein
VIVSDVVLLDFIDGGHCTPCEVLREPVVMLPIGCVRRTCAIQLVTAFGSLREEDESWVEVDLLVLLKSRQDGKIVTFPCFVKYDRLERGYKRIAHEIRDTDSTSKVVSGLDAGPIQVVAGNPRKQFCVRC